jgi:hypothetical protein
MTEANYFQNPEDPDHLFEIVRANRETHKVVVLDREGQEMELDLNLLKLLHWRIVKKEE